MGLQLAKKSPMVETALVFAALATIACGGPAGESPAATPPTADEAAPSGPTDAGSAGPGTDPAAGEDIPKGQGTPGVAPPFSAEQIRDATHPGRRYLFSVDSAGQPPMRYQIDFLSRTDDDTTYRVTVINATGQEVSRKEQTETWNQLEAHAEFPPGQTKMRELTFTVPAGTYEGYVYEVEDPKTGIRSRLFFAADLPGAAVKVEVEELESGKQVRKMELLEHQPGTPTPR